MNTENYVFIVGSCYYIQQRQRLGSVEERVANLSSLVKSVRL